MSYLVWLLRCSFLLFLVSSSLRVLVNYLVVVELHLLLKLLIPEFHCLLILFANVMSIPQGL
jgi:hypothetical protein